MKPVFICLPLYYPTSAGRDMWINLQHVDYIKPRSSETTWVHLAQVDEVTSIDLPVAEVIARIAEALGGQ